MNAYNFFFITPFRKSKYFTEADKNKILYIYTKLNTLNDNFIKISKTHLLTKHAH